MKISLKFTFLFILITFISGCSTPRNSEWISIPSNEDKFQKKDIDITYISIDKLNEAKKKLDTSEYIIINDNEYLYLSGKIKSGPKIPILVRATVWAYNPNGFSIYQNEENELYIFHTVLSKSKIIRSWPIIIFVNDIPKKVYNNCSVTN